MNRLLSILLCIAIRCDVMIAFCSSRCFSRSLKAFPSSTVVFNIEAPSDSHDLDDDLLSPGASVGEFYVETEEDIALREALKRELLLMSSVTSRGEYIASREEQDLIVDIVTQLEALNPTADPALNCDGRWDLCMAGTFKPLSIGEAGKKSKGSNPRNALLRISPFFLTLRTILGENNKAILQLLEETLLGNGRIVTFGRLQQIISDRELRSEVSVESTAGVFSLLPLPQLKLKIVTTASLSILPPMQWNLELKETTIDTSSSGVLSKIPSTAIPVGQLLSKVNKEGKVPLSSLKTMYVDEGIRITRDEDENFFVFARE